jgi:hypothetical protein
MLKTFNLDEMTLWIKMLLYGPQGVGKTTWTAMNCPKPAHWLDFERSTDTLIAMFRAGLLNKDDFRITPVGPGDKPSDVQAIVKNIEKSGNQTIVFDTMTTSQIFQLQEHMKDQTRDLPLFQDYRLSTHIFSEMFMQLQHSDVNVVLIAHERENWQGEPPNRVLRSIVPSVTPALHDAVTQLVSDVVRLQKKTAVGRDAVPEWSMLMNTKGVYIAKNRAGVIAPEIKNPTWDLFTKGTVE